MFNNHYTNIVEKHLVLHLNFDFPTAKVEDIIKKSKSLNPRKVTGSDGNPVKILKIARNLIDSHLKNIIKRDIKENKFSED